MSVEPDSDNNAAWNEDGLPQELAKQEGPSGMWSLPPENASPPAKPDQSDLLYTIIDTFSEASQLVDLLKENDVLLGFGKNSRHAARWHIELTNGSVYNGTDGASLLKALKAIDANKATIKIMNIKGHGNKLGVYDNKNEGLFIIPEPTTHKPNSTNVMVGNAIVTDILKRRTQVGTQITLDGCSTLEAAENLANLLPGIRVTGTPTPVLNIPFTRYYVGPFWTYEASPTPQVVNPK